MKVFREMISLVTAQSLNKIEVIDEKQTADAGNLYLQLFKGIADGSYSNDDAAAQAIYNTRASDKKYLMLKSRLKDRIINSLFFINHKKLGSTPYQQAVYVCNRNYFCAKLLLTHGARNSAIAMAKSTLTLACKYDLNEVTLLCSRMLRHHNAMDGKKRDFLRYSKLAATAFASIKAENRAEYMYETLITEFARSKAFKPELEQTAREYFSQCKELAKYQGTFHLNILYYRIGTLYYQIIRNYQFLLQLCNKQQQYLKNHPDFYLSSREGEISLLKMVCCLHLKDFTQGKINAEQALKLYKKGSNNWFTVLENLFLLTMHSGKYENAAAIVEEVVHHPRFHLLHEQKHETWKIFEAYINYLIPGKSRSKDFKIHKFLNEVPIYSKDKAGFYPAILIAQLLYLLELEDEDKLERNIESLRIFSSRNLSGKKAPRTEVFIKMLRQLIQYNYDLKRVNQRCEKYLAQLKDSKFTADGEIDSMEIIPYEQAWVIILSRLQEKRIGSNMKRV